jgi:hypothetical protein
MKHRTIKALGACGLFSLLAAAQSSAVTVALYDPGNSGIGSISYEVSGTLITVTENWTGSGSGILSFRGLAAGVNYTLRKIINNNSGDSWTRFANELLDPLDNNDSNDVTPYPGFVPTGFSTSNDFDGLSFAQGSGISRTSTTWSTVTADELTDARDFLDFSNGTLANGSSDTMQFGLRDNSGANQPFLLIQRPNASSTSVPDAGSTFALLGLSLLGLAKFRAKKH